MSRTRLKHSNEPIKAADGVMIFERLDHLEIVFTATHSDSCFTITKDIPISVLSDLLKRRANSAVPR